MTERRAQEVLHSGFLAQLADAINDTVHAAMDDDRGEIAIELGVALHGEHGLIRQLRPGRLARVHIRTRDPLHPRSCRLLRLLVGRGDGDEPRYGSLPANEGVTVSAKLIRVQIEMARALPERGVRPEHHRMAMLARPAHGTVRSRSQPDRRVRLLERLRQHLDIPELPELPFPVQAFIAPCRQHDLDGLVEASSALLDRHAEGSELGRVEAAPRAPVDAPAGEHVEQRDLLRQPQRVIEGRERYAHPNAQPAGLVGDVQAHHVNGGTNAVAREVMLGEPDGVVSSLFHDLGALHRTLIDGRQRASSPRPAKELEGTDSHRSTALSQFEWRSA